MNTLIPKLKYYVIEMSDMIQGKIFTSDDYMMIWMIVRTSLTAVHIPSFSSEKIMFCESFASFLFEIDSSAFLWSFVDMWSESADFLKFSHPLTNELVTMPSSLHAIQNIFPSETVNQGNSLNHALTTFLWDVCVVVVLSLDVPGTDWLGNDDHDRPTTLFKILSIICFTISLEFSTFENIVSAGLFRFWLFSLVACLVFLRLSKSKKSTRIWWPGADTGRVSRLICLHLKILELPFLHNS